MTTKEKRKHIKPFLRYAISEMQKDWDIDNSIDGLCKYAYQYAEIVLKCPKNWNRNYPVSNYIIERLKIARPEGSVYINEYGNESSYWWGSASLFNSSGLQNRIDFCKLQLKIVKP